MKATALNAQRKAWQVYEGNQKKFFTEKQTIDVEKMHAETLAFAEEVVESGLASKVKNINVVLGLTSSSVTFEIG